MKSIHPVAGSKFLVRSTALTAATLVGGRFFLGLVLCLASGLTTSSARSRF